MTELKKSKIECPQCLERFKHPVLLKCGHCLCLECAERQFSIEVLKVADPLFGDLSSVVPIACSICGAETLILREKGVREMLVGHSRSISEEETREGLKVCRCNEPATSYCEACNAAFCHRCYCQVHADPSLKHHDKSPLLKQSPTCSEHSLTLDLYCFYCDKVVCSKCAQDIAHSGHRILNLDECSSYISEKINRVVSDLAVSKDRYKSDAVHISDSLQSLNSNNKVARNLITKTFEKIQATAEMKKQQLLGNLDNVYKNERTRIEIQRQAVQKLLDSSVKTLARVQNADLAEKVNIKHLISRLVKEFESCPRINVVNSRVEANSELSEQQILLILSRMNIRLDIGM